MAPWQRFASLASFALVLDSASAVSLRQSLLCEAHYRLGTWYTDPNMLASPKVRDDVTLQITRDDVFCGGNKVPVLFGSFDVDAHPFDTFNALANATAEPEWDPAASQSRHIGDWPDEAARGIALAYSAHPFADREVFEWQVFEGNSDEEHFDMMVVYSTMANAELHKKLEREWGSTAAQNCLAAYRVQRRPDGLSHVTFTSHVNAHPFLVSQSFVFNVLWGKSVDYCVSLRERAKTLGAMRQGAPPRLEVPEWLLQTESSPSIEAPYTCDHPARMFEVLPGDVPTALRAGLPAWPAALAAVVLAAAAVAVGGPVRRFHLAARLRSRAPPAVPATAEERLEAPAEAEALLVRLTASAPAP